VRYVETTPLFTVADLRLLYGDAMSDRTIFNMLDRLKKQERVRSVTRGVYSGVRSPGPPSRYEVPSKLRPDAVIACHSALEFHGVANQVFQTVYYFSARPRADVVFEGVTYHCVHPVAQLARRFDFQVETGPNKVRVTVRERAVVDSLVFLEYSGGSDELDRCLAMFPSFNFELALTYLRLLRQPWLYARLGYLLDRHGERLLFSRRWRDAFLRKLPRGTAYLEKKRPGGRWISTWNLMVPESLTLATEQVAST
jgi:predicted transcriptional regulator of viral defense system